MWSLDIQIDAVENTLVSQRQKLQYALFAILLYNLKKNTLKNYQIYLLRLKSWQQYIIFIILNRINE